MARGRAQPGLVGEDHGGVERWQETLVQDLALLLHLQGSGIFGQFVLHNHQAPARELKVLPTDQVQHENEHAQDFTKTLTDGVWYRWRGKTVAAENGQTY